MAKGNQPRITHRTMRGKLIDMDILRKKNELTPAIGNARVNARGDELGPGGKIIRKREDLVKDYYDKGNTVRDTSGRAKKSKVAANETKIPVEELTLDEKELMQDDEWIEDDDGNFVKKGE
jgi:hypothetical protein